MLLGVPGKQEFMTNASANNESKQAAWYSPFSWNRSKLPVILSVVAILSYYLLNIAIISPHGNFPLNDDWCYGNSVKILLDTCRFQLPASCTTCILHIYLGALICKLFGFSYTALRSLTLFVGILGAISVFATLRTVKLSPYLAGLSTLVFVANPLLVNLCFSYMNDILALTCSTLYMFCMIKGIRHNSRGYFLGAATALICSLACRQSAAIFIVSNIAVLCCYWLQRKHSWTLLLTLVVLPAVTFIGLEKWLEHSQHISIAYTTFKTAHIRFFQTAVTNPLSVCPALLIALGQVACYFALFCLPILTPLIPRLFNCLKMNVQVIWAFISSAVLATSLNKLVLHEHRLMPFCKNLLRIPMVGSLTIMGVNCPPLKPGYYKWLTGISAAFAFVLLTFLGIGLQRTVVLVQRSFFPVLSQQVSSRILRQATIYLFCFVSLVLTLGFVTVETAIWDIDRHYLMAFVPMLICLALVYRWLRIRPMWITSLILLVGIAAYSTLSTQDYLNWNRARWKALSALELQKIPSKDIDGGAEYNFASDASLFDSQYRGPAPHDQWRWWPIHSETYIVSFSPIPGYETIIRSPYWSSLNFSNREVLVLKKL